MASISGIKLATKIYKKFGINIAAKKILVGTVETIENELLQNWMSGKIYEEKKITTDVTSAKISGVQRGIYLECMKNPLATIYNVTFILNFQNDLNISELSAAVKKIISSHQSVNIHFELQDEDIMQVANSKTDFNIPVKNITENEFADLKNNFVQPFKLSAEPLYRFMIVQTEKRMSLFADFHHLIFDGVSMNLFFANLQTALEGKNIEPEKFSYFDYVGEESTLIENKQKYFTDLLKDFETASEITSDSKNSADEVKIFDSPLNIDAIDGYL